jgi:hypothetical protein
MCLARFFKSSKTFLRILRGLAAIDTVFWKKKNIFSLFTSAVALVLGFATQIPEFGKQTTNI